MTAANIFYKIYCTFINNHRVFGIVPIKSVVMLIQNTKVFHIFFYYKKIIITISYRYAIISWSNNNLSKLLCQYFWQFPRSQKKRIKKWFEYFLDFYVKNI